MKTKLSKYEMLILVGFILFFVVIAVLWLIENRNKLHAKLTDLQKEIRLMRISLRDFVSKQAKYRRRAFFVMVIFKLISIGLFFCYVQWIHWQFNLNPIASGLGAYSSIVGVYYLVMFLVSNKIYSLTEFLEMIHDGLTKLFLSVAKVDVKQIPILINKIEEKEKQAKEIRDKLKKR